MELRENVLWIGILYAGFRSGELNAAFTISSYVVHERMSEK